MIVCDGEPGRIDDESCTRARHVRLHTFEGILECAGTDDLHHRAADVCQIVDGYRPGCRRRRCLRRDILPGQLSGQLSLRSAIASDSRAAPAKIPLLISEVSVFRRAR